MKKLLSFTFLILCLPTIAQISHYNYFNEKTTFSNEPTTKWKSTCEVISDKQEIIIKKYSETAINQKYNKDGLIESINKTYYFSKDTTIKKKSGKVYYIKEQLDLDEVNTEEVESKIVILDSMLYYFNKYEFEQYTQTKKQISSKITLTKPTKTQGNSTTKVEKKTSEEKKAESETISMVSFEKHIMNGSTPNNSAVQTKYQDGYRAIAWDVPQTKSYEYSDEVFSKLGYDVVQSDYKNKRAYRNCTKGILVEIGKCDFKQGLCLTMEWFSPNSKRQNKYFMFCQ